MHTGILAGPQEIFRFFEGHFGEDADGIQLPLLGIGKQPPQHSHFP